MFDAGLKRPGMRRVDAGRKIAYIGRRMVELEKRISGDWIELKEKSEDFHALLDVLAPPRRELRDAATKLRLSVEQGIVEFKRTMLSPVLVALETARYKSLAGDGDGRAGEVADALLLLAILVQRLLCSGRASPLARPRKGSRGPSAWICR